MRSVVVAMLLAGVGAACGTADRENQPASLGSAPPPTADISAELPLTTLLQPPPDDARGPSETPAVVSEPCPESSAPSDAGAEMGAEVTRLEPMIGQVLAYGSRHPEQFGSYGLIWHDAGDASVFISFTGGLAAHREALAAVVPFPDELIVCQVAYSGPDSQALQAQLVKELEGRFLSIGQGAEGLAVTLAANEAELAADLHTRHGDAIDLYVGALAFPIDRATSVCGDPPAGTALPGLSITIDPPAGPIAAAGTQPADLTVTVTNTGDTPIQFTSGTAIGTLLDSAGSVVNSNEIAVTAVGMPVDLEPGESTALPMVVSTASCDPTLGYVVPPGEYQLITEVQHANGELTKLTSQPTIVTVGP